MMKKLIIAILVIISALYLKFIVFNPYKWKGDLIMKDNVTYQDSPELFRKYLNGDIKSGETIGRVTGNHFIEFNTWVIKLEGFDEEETFLIRGLMYEAVYTKVDE